MRVLHVVKTSEGAWWAAKQVAELVRDGIEVHVAVPSAQGRALPYWRASGATIHLADLDLPARQPWRLPEVARTARALVARVSPDLIHSHFFGPTQILRLALGRSHSVPRIFQVPGPLHLEHWPFRKWDTYSAGEADFWIGSSKHIVNYYMRSGLGRDRVFLSYHGGSGSPVNTRRSGNLRRRLGIGDDHFVVGNVNFMYPPKRHLGQTVGLKCHEDVIDALGVVLAKRRDVVGVLIGEAYRNAKWYEEKLRRRAQRAGGQRILLPGYMSQTEIAECWADFDCAVHVPLSESCGGVLEPLLASVPTIAGRNGGLPELVIDGLTGKAAEVRRPKELASAILEVLEDLPRYRRLAADGCRLVRTMFDVQRTAGEVAAIYAHLLDRSKERPADFDSVQFARSLANVPRPAAAAPDPRLGEGGRNLPSVVGTTGCKESS